MSKNKLKIAVALSYDQTNDTAPHIIAKGSAGIAEKILSIAKECNIHVHKDNELAQILSSFEIDALIPLEAYQAVAEILSYIYRRYQPSGNIL